MSQGRPPIPDELLGAIYDAAGDARMWRDVVAQAARWVGGVAGSFQARTFGDAPQVSLLSTGIDPTLHDAYLVHYSKDDPHLRHIARLGIQHTLLSSEIIPDAELKRTEFYDGFYRPQGLADLQGAVLIKTDTLLVTLAMFADARHRFDAASKARHDALAPHFGRAVGLALRFGAYDALQSAMACAAATESVAALQVDADLNLVMESGAAAHASWLRDTTLPVFVEHARLAARAPLHLEQLREAVRLAFAGQAGSVCFDGEHGRITLAVAPAALPLARQHARHATILMFRDSFTEDPYAARIAELSPSLQRVAQLLTRGLSDKDIARELGYSLATARTYTARVLARLGVSDRRVLIARAR